MSFSGIDLIYGRLCCPRLRVYSSSSFSIYSAILSSREIPLPYHGIPLATFPEPVIEQFAGESFSCRTAMNRLYGSFSDQAVRSAL